MRTWLRPANVIRFREHGVCLSVGPARTQRGACRFASDVHTGAGCGCPALRVYACTRESVSLAHCRPSVVWPSKGKPTQRSRCSLFQFPATISTERPCRLQEIRLRLDNNRVRELDFCPHAFVTWSTWRWAQ